MATPDRYAEVVSRVHERAPLIGMARDFHRNDRGAPIRFDDKPYLIALYALLPKVRAAVFRKAVQTGISEALILLTLYKSGWLGQKCAYALPTDPVAARFVADRINPLIESVPQYRSKLPFGAMKDRKADVGSVARKRFGKGFLRFMGAATKSNWVEFSTDLMVVDEYDLCEPEHVAMAPDRLKASSDPSLIIVGNPTAAGVGIDAAYTAGTRGQWFQRCDHCKHRQALDWFIHFVDRNDAGMWVPKDTERAQKPEWGDLRPVCVRCGRPFERTGAGASWVHERASDPLIPLSFTMSHMDMLARAPEHQPMREMYVAWVSAQGDDEKLVKFFQSRLGLPKRPQGASLTADMLRRFATGTALDHTGATRGGKMLVLSSDVGSVFHVSLRQIVEDLDVSVGYRSRTVWAGTTTTWTGLEAIWDRYSPGITVVDAGPEGTAAREFCAKVERKMDGAQAYRCAFHSGARVAGKDLAFNKKISDRLVTVDRTQAMDRAFYDLRDGLHTLPSDIFTVPNWSSQMCAPVRQVREDGTAFWSKGEKGNVGQDHFRLSDTYGRVGLQIAIGSGCEPSPSK